MVVSHNILHYNFLNIVYFLTLAIIMEHRQRESSMRISSVCCFLLFSVTFETSVLSPKFPSETRRTTMHSSRPLVTAFALSNILSLLCVVPPFVYTCMFMFACPLFPCRPCLPCLFRLCHLGSISLHCVSAMTPKSSPSLPHG